MALPSTGITMIAVAKTLGYYAYPLYLSLLCKHQNINKWSKWKPIASTASTLTNDVIKANNYGFTNYIGSNLNYIVSWITGDTLYNYIKPSGTTLSPYRLGDFRTYENSAPVPYTYNMVKNDGYRNNYRITATLNNNAQLSINDFFPASEHPNASLVLLDKSRNGSSSYNVYTLNNSIVVDGSYSNFYGSFTVSSAETGQYYHDCVMAIKDGSIYCVLPSTKYSWFYPMKSPHISFDNGQTWQEMDNNSGEITILQGNGNHKKIYVRTGFPIDLINRSNWIHSSVNQIPASTTNPPADYDFEIILDRSTSNRQGYLEFANSNYAFGYSLLVKQRTTVPNVTISCEAFGTTSGKNKFAVFHAINTSETVGANATFYIKYTLASGAEYTVQKYVDIPNYEAGLEGVSFDVYFTSYDNTEITSIKFQPQADNIGTITFTSGQYMDNQGNLIL